MDILTEGELMEAGYPTIDKVKRKEKVGLWSLGIMERIAQAQIDKLRKLGRLRDEPPKYGKCGKCGGEMSLNPHPLAGKPPDYLTVGTVHECIPCLVKSRHGWAERAMKAETELANKPEPPADKVEAVKALLDKVITSRQYGYITPEDKTSVAKEIVSRLEPDWGKLREEIAKEIGQHAENCTWEDCTSSEKDAAYRSADFILDLIKGYRREKWIN